MPRSSKKSLPFSLFDQIFVYISDSSHVCCMPHPPQPSFQHSSNMVKVSLCLIKHNAMKMYGGMEV
jgi:hypothetical protein